MGDRIYSGGSEYQRMKSRSSAEKQARSSAFSTATTDTFDYTTVTSKPIPTTYSGDTKRDDFFDDDPDKYFHTWGCWQLNDITQLTAVVDH